MGEIQQKTGHPTIDLCFDTFAKNKQALVFVNTKSSAEKTAEDIAKKIKETSPELTALAEKVGNVLSRPTKQCERLKRCVTKGIAFHHAGLHSTQKQLVEEAFRSKVIKAICSTPTLAAGLDLPAFRAILRDVKRFSQRGMVFIPVLEYLQMAGRAGRPKFDSHGEAIIVAKNEGVAGDLEDRYLWGKPEAIYSKLAVEPVLRSSLLSLIATKFCGSRHELQEFFSKTFWAHQYQDMPSLYAIIDRVLKQLQDWGFVICDSTEEFATADVFGSDNPSYRATPLGVRVSQLYLDPYTAQGFVKGLARAQKFPKIHFYSWLLFVTSTLEMRPHSNVGRKEWDAMMAKMNSVQGCMLATEPSVYDAEFDEFLGSAKTAALLEGWAEEFDDEYLLETYKARPGELRAKLSIADWLTYSLNEIAYVLGYRDLQKEIRKLRLRLKYGVREELLPLLKLKGIGRMRARKLFSHGLTSIPDLIRVELGILNRLLGPTLAASVKKQLGQPVPTVVSAKKRKGQMGLGKYT